MHYVYGDERDTRKLIIISYYMIEEFRLTLQSILHEMPANTKYPGKKMIFNPEHENIYKVIT